MNEYRTIKELVVETCMNENEFPSYEKLTSLVLKHFPKSKWQKTHYSWYKSKIKNGDIIIPGFETNTKVLISNDEIENDIEETINSRLSLEKDLHSYLSMNINEIEENLVLAEDGIEYQIDAGRIDLLAKDNQDNTVVIELKAGKASDSALGQLLGYIGCLSEKPEKYKNIRGILVASEFDKRVIYAVKNLPNIKLIRYQVAFKLQEIV